MLIASYKSTRPGLQGIANRLIRLRLRSIYSHCEVVFEPLDNVGHLMPDGSCAPGPDGALWCASSVAAEALPAHSPRRAAQARLVECASSVSRSTLITGTRAK